MNYTIIITGTRTRPKTRMNNFGTQNPDLNPQYQFCKTQKPDPPLNFIGFSSLAQTTHQIQLWNIWKIYLKENEKKFLRKVLNVSSRGTNLSTSKSRGRNCSATNILLYRVDRMITFFICTYCYFCMAFTSNCCRVFATYKSNSHLIWFLVIRKTAYLLIILHFS
jgi:hypothetical protein